MPYGAVGYVLVEPRPFLATHIFFFRFAVKLFTLRSCCCVNFYSINLLFSLNNMSLSLPSDLPDDYTYVYSMHANEVSITP